MHALFDTQPITSHTLPSISAPFKGMKFITDIYLKVGHFFSNTTTPSTVMVVTTTAVLTSNTNRFRRGIYFGARNR